MPAQHTRLELILAGMVGALVVVFIFTFIAGRVVAQSVPNAYALVVASCGTAPASYSSGWPTAAANFQPLTINTAGSLCVNQ